ncbi:MAG: hypothetical protein MJA31_03470 [Clostridia bacterium]|nr:hypothetical protein [Clostridia bacterium]
MAKLTEQMSSLTGRVGAIESNTLDDNAPISLIFKVYNDIGIKARITIALHQFPICSETLYCSGGLII